jgi:hypothetical protein
MILSQTKNDGLKIKETKRTKSFNFKPVFFRTLTECLMVLCFLTWSAGSGAMQAVSIIFYASLLQILQYHLQILINCQNKFYLLFKQ